MNARDLIRSNTGPQSGLVFNADYSKSFFAPKGWSKTTNFSTQKMDITPVNPTQDASASTIEFRVVKNADYYGFPYLQIPFAAITPGTGATFTRFVDYVGLHSQSSLQMSHVSNLLARVDGTVIQPVYLKNSDARRRFQWDPLLLGNLSPLTRNILATGAQVAQVPLDNLFWFTYSTSCFIPVIVLSHEIRIEVTFNPQSYFIQTDATSGTPTTSISTQTIKGVSYPLQISFLCVHITGDERVNQVAFYEGQGLMVPFTEFKLQPRYTILSGTAGVISIRLTAIKDQISEIYWVIRRQVDVTSSNYTNNPNRRLSYVSFNITGNGGELVAWHTKEYIDRRLREQYHSSWAGEDQNIGFYSFSWVPEDEVNNLGYIHAGQISDPILNINVGTAAGQSDAYDVLNGTGPELGSTNVVVDIYVNASNWLHHIGGDINKVFN